MKPATLLLRDLLRAHSIFLMHHDTSLSALFVRCKRNRFVAMLSRYWDLFLSTWNVMLHGNPARDIFWGINVAGSGELGIGVGEEDRGSGEREVLEGLVGRIEGLVDLVVSKFGSHESEDEGAEASSRGDLPSWLGSGREPGADDGAIFLGTGALSKKSLRDVTQWMEDLYTWGEHAYGVIESPTSVRRRKEPRDSKSEGMGAAQPADKAAAEVAEAQTTSEPREQATPEIKEPDKEAADEGRLDKMVGYLKLGYGSYWTLPGFPGDSSSEAGAATPDQRPDQRPEKRGIGALLTGRPKMPSRSSSDGAGHYLIGLKGDIEEEVLEQDAGDESDDPDTEHNSRTVLRTVNVELEREAEPRPEATIVHDFHHPGSLLMQSQIVGNLVPGYDSHDLNKAKKLRVVVYVNKPFIFTFFFHLRTDSLAWDALYRSLHYQLSPLKKSLVPSTSYRPDRPSMGSASQGINDLVWDPTTLTVHSTIPSIPEHYDEDDEWSRADALSTHLHILNIYGSTRRDTSEMERTEKTNRGWWIVWTRVLERRGDASANLSTIHESASETDAASNRSEPDDEPSPPSKEILLVRRASDHAGLRGVSGSHLEGGGEGPGKLVQGIGVDTRRYIEELLSLL